MTPLGPHLTVFLREYLPSQREVSVQTSDTYAYAFQLLVCFAAERLKTTPSALSIEQLDATLMLAFLEHLEKERRNTFERPEPRRLRWPRKGFHRTP
jgi:integrase/recombinase XerD